MSKNWMNSGRIETFLALIVLVAVLGLFLKFHWADAPTVPEPTEIQTPAAPQPTSPTQ